MAASEPSARPLDVLTVGDGNFSFSLAFLRKHGAAVRLVATSFDSYEELVAKYPESARLCAQLAELGATVLHRVDATNLQVSLRNAVLGGAGDRDGDGDANARAREQHVHERFFDRVIFNHPHCGEENVARHQSLLSHFYVAAQRVLRRGSGRIHLTLAEGQPERWEARERARKAGLGVAHEIHNVDADEEHAVSYERKRHQNGKSFHRVLLHGERKQQASTLFVLAVAVDEVANDAVRAESLPAKAIADASTTTTRKRKLSESPSCVAVAEETVALPASSFVCEPCEKTFKTAQGLKTHVHMVHELGVAGGATPKQAKPQFPCGQCERTFRNEDARRQHQISKHGDDASIRPDWFRPLAEPSQPEAMAGAGADVDGTKTCSICELQFPDGAAFDAHWQELQPKTVVRRVCSLCGKSFEEERALRQHQNFCRTKAVERNAVSGSSR